MTRRIIDLDDPGRFVVGTASGLGGTAFYLQAARGPRVISVALEREQLALLADRMLTIIDELERRGLVAIDTGLRNPDERAPRSDGLTRRPESLALRSDERALDPPSREDFVVGALTIAWDDDGDRLIVEAHSISFDAGAGESAPPPGVDDDDKDHDHPEDIPDDDPIGPDVLRVRLTPVMAQRFARRAMHISAVGRQICPLCGSSLGVGHHRCPGQGDHRGSDR